MTLGYRMKIAILGAALMLAGCETGSSGGSVYYDPYPYRTGIYIHHDHYYRPDRPNRPVRPPNHRPRPPHRPRPLPARGRRR